MPTSRRSTFPVAILALVATLAALAGSEATAAAPKVGAAAPEFRLQDQAGKWVTLQEQRGKWVVLYFYPKDNTPGCTTQACGFRDDIFAFRRANATILGISVDDVESHDKFAKEHSLPFSILADSSKQTTKTYGIAKHYADVDTEGHSKLVLTDLKKLQGG
jgi:thioredoxin-dependent peroxiredoxin